MTNLFQSGYFALHSGLFSDWKIECDALADEDIETLALLISRIVLPFSSVEGVPQGGIRLAKALEKRCTPDADYHMIVDDVMTTGNSMRNAAYEYQKTHNSAVIGAVVFQRGPSLIWVSPLFKMPRALWVV